MLIVEVEDGGNMGIIHRLMANGFDHNEKLDYIDRERGGFNIEVWTKNDRKKGRTYLDFSDLPEIEE